MQDVQEEDIFKRYHDEFLQDVKIDELNMKERAMTIAAIKHKWVGRLMRHKLDLTRLERAKKQAITKLASSMSSQKVGLTETAAKKMATSHELVERINAEYERNELLIEYLEKVERILNSMTYDIKNLIDIQKLEVL